MFTSQLAAQLMVAPLRMTQSEPGEALQPRANRRRHLMGLLSAAGVLAWPSRPGYAEDEDDEDDDEAPPPPKVRKTFLLVQLVCS